MVLVADAGLGTINAVRLSVGAFADFPVVVALNRYGDDDPLHARNLEHLTEVDGFDVVTAPRTLADRLRLSDGGERDPPLAVGIPRERKEGEHRVAITPDGVHEFVVHDVPVIVEHDAGRRLVDHRRRLTAPPGAEIVDRRRRRVGARRASC